MNRFVPFGILLILASCGQPTEKTTTNSAKDTLTSKIIDTAQAAPPTAGTIIHETLNENIEPIPENLKSFVPEGYAIMNISTGDANLDGLPDTIIVLRKKSEESTSNFEAQRPDKRPLLLLLGQPDKSLKLIAKNDNAVYCIDCGGLFGDPFTGTTIKNGYFSIEHGISGGRHYEHVTTFKYDKSKKDWFLYKDHYVSYKLNDGNDPNAEALTVDEDKTKTVKDFGSLSFEKFNIYNNDER